MRSAVRYTVVSLLLAAWPVHAQSPTLSAEVKKLEAWVGTWAYEGEAKATPLGAAAKIAGMQTGRMIASGFGLEWSGEEKGVFGAVHWTERDVYDPVTKTYPYFGVQTDGVIWSGANAIVGNVWKGNGTQTVKGVAYKVRADSTPAADGKSWTQKFEMSSDGKTWVPWMDIKMTKRP